MSAEKLGATANNRAHTPARFITLNGEDGKVILNLTCIVSASPIKKTGADAEMESAGGKFKTRVQMINGQHHRVTEETSVIAQVLSADGVHGTSR